MPKARVERVTQDDGKFQTVEVDLEQRGETKTATFTRPTLSHFRDYILSLSDSAKRKDDEGKDTSETELAWAHRMFVTSLDRVARSAVYESLAQESTFITVGKDRVDIMTFPPERLVKAINGMRTQVETRALVGGGTEDAYKAAERSVGYGPWKTAAKRIVEGYEKDGRKIKGVENEQSGMLELVPA